MPQDNIVDEENHCEFSALLKCLQVDELCRCARQDFLNNVGTRRVQSSTRH